MKLRKNYEKIRSYWLLRNYGITINQYNEMLENQNGVCKICSGINKSGRALVVDHNHKTGEVRALLCTGCNVKLAWLEGRRHFYGIGNLRSSTKSFLEMVIASGINADFDLTSNLYLK